MAHSDSGACFFTAELACGREELAIRRAELVNCREELASSREGLASCQKELGICREVLERSKWEQAKRMKLRRAEKVALSERKSALRWCISDGLALCLF